MRGQRIGQRGHAQQEGAPRLGQRLLGLQHHGKGQKPRRLVQTSVPAPSVGRKPRGLGQHIAALGAVQREGGRQDAAAARHIPGIDSLAIRFSLPKTLLFAHGVRLYIQIVQ
jgi:hypothetical protein